MNYVNFDLRIGQSQVDGTCLIQARSSLAGDALAKCDASTLAGLATGSLADVGRRLFRAAFVGDVGRCYVASRAGLGDDQGLRVRLELQDPALAALPWELLYDEAGMDDFIALSLRSPIVRYLAALVPINSVAVNSPLRVLVVTAAPSDLAPLDVVGERKRIESALESLQSASLVDSHFLEGATKDALQDQLRKEYHVFHFIGHGAFDVGGGGALVLEDSCGESELLTANELSTLLADNQIRLAVLNSCHTAEPGGAGPAWGVGPRLARTGVPAVIGMRAAILDRLAVVFTREFYETLASGHSIESALTEARKALMLASGRNRPDWSLPALFMRCSDGNLVNPQVITGGRRYLQLSLATRIDFEKRGRDTSAGLQTLLRRVLKLLNPAQIAVNIKVEAHLGAALRLIRPVNTAVMGPLTFCWAMGEEIAHSCWDVGEEMGVVSPLRARVTILDEDKVVWQSPEEPVALTVPIDVMAEGERIRQLVCPKDVYDLLETRRKYHWQLALTYSALDYKGRVMQQTIHHQAAFRLVERDEEELLRLSLAVLPSHGGEVADIALLRGAIYEASGLYDEATREYELALVEETLSRQVYGRLAGLYAKRAYALLGLPGEKPVTEPISDFAQRANHYGSLAAAGISSG